MFQRLNYLIRLNRRSYYKKGNYHIILVQRINENEIFKNSRRDQYPIRFTHIFEDRYLTESHCSRLVWRCVITLNTFLCQTKTIVHNYSSGTGKCYFLFFQRACCRFLSHWISLLTALRVSHCKRYWNTRKPFSFYYYSLHHFSTKQYNAALQSYYFMFFNAITVLVTRTYIHVCDFGFKPLIFNTRTWMKI